MRLFGLIALGPGLVLRFIGAATSLACSVAVIACGGSHSARTETRIYDPYEQDGTFSRRLVVEAHKSGSCNGGSESAHRSDAWRCFTGNDIADPCFAKTGKVVICPESPWSTRVTRIDSRDPLPVDLENDDDPHALPWALELADGKHCTFVGGATTDVAGRRLNYECRGGPELYGKPSSGPVQSIMAPDKQAGALRPLRIRVEWR